MNRRNKNQKPERSTVRVKGFLSRYIKGGSRHEVVIAILFARRRRKKTFTLRLTFSKILILSSKTSNFYYHNGQKKQSKHCVAGLVDWIQLYEKGEETCQIQFEEEYENCTYIFTHFNYTTRGLEDLVSKLSKKSEWFPGNEPTQNFLNK